MFALVPVRVRLEIEHRPVFEIVTPKHLVKIEEADLLSASACTSFCIVLRNRTLPLDFSLLARQD
jgi:hypothetical protein